MPGDRVRGVGGVEVGAQEPAAVGGVRSSRRIRWSTANTPGGSVLFTTHTAVNSTHPPTETPVPAPDPPSLVAAVHATRAPRTPELSELPPRPTLLVAAVHASRAPRQPRRAQRAPDPPPSVAAVRGPAPAAQSPARPYATPQTSTASAA